jgi:hypothetical protein
MISTEIIVGFGMISREIIVGFVGVAWWLRVF